MTTAKQFESDIILGLAQAVPASGAYFYDDTGCLCVPADAATACQVLAELNRITNNRVQINGPVQGEYLIDFL
jgi:hypothetical protein